MILKYYDNKVVKFLVTALCLQSGQRDILFLKIPFFAAAILD